MSPALVHLDVPTQDFVIIPIFLVNRQLSIPIDLLGFFSLFASGKQNGQKGKGKEKGMLEGISGVCSSHQG